MTHRAIGRVERKFSNMVQIDITLEGIHDGVLVGRETQGHEILRATIHGDLVGVEAEIVPPKIGFRASVSITRVIGIINSAQPLIA